VKIEKVIQKNKIHIFVTLTIGMTQELFARYSFLLDRTARKVKQYAQQQFKQGDFDVTVDQWLILKNLSENGHLSQTELASLVFKDHPTLTRILDLLCKKGYVERVPHPVDRRSFQLHLTENGVKKVTELKPKVLEIREKAWENLNETDFEEFKRILNTIYQNLDGQTFAE
jgi:DNA-binding MarR family transcriptional regulator